jgi:hypothetical protein
LLGLTTRDYSSDGYTSTRFWRIKVMTTCTLTGRRHSPALLTSLLAALLLVAAAPAFAQSNFGSLRGQVTDANGAAIAGATVRIVDAGTNATVTLTTGEDGGYVAPSLRPVTYNVTAEAKGYKRTTVSGVKVDTAKDSGLDITLEPGEVTDTVNVTGDAPLVQTETGTVTRTVDQRTIVDVPLNGRNTLELALTLPATSGSAGSELAGFGVNDVTPGRELSINGGRAGSTQFYADGANVTSLALARTSVSFTPDTIQEFSVQQSNYSAQFSQAGGAIIQQTTKSGTNEFHGTLYWFHRQKAFTASPFNATRVAATNFDPRPPLRRQQIGATIGGPVWLPKKYFGPAAYDGRNRTFFFFSYEPTRQVASNPGGPTFERVPTELELNGDFSQSKVYQPNGTTLPYAPLYNQFIKLPDGTLAYRPRAGFTGAPSASNPRFQFNNFPLFDNNGTRLSVNGVSYVNPVAQRIARELFPRPNIPFIQEPNNPNNGANYVYFRATDNRDDRYTLRLDQRLGENHQIYGRYTDQPFFGNRFFRDPLSSGINSENNKARQILVNWTGSLKPTLVNELRVGYVFGDFSRTYPSVLQNRDLTSEYLDIGGPGRGLVNTLGYGGARFFPGATPNGFDGTTNRSAGRGFGIAGFNSPQDVGKTTEHTYSISDDLTWSRGVHTIKSGFSGTLLMLNQASAGLGNQAGGRFAYNSQMTGDRYCNPQPFGGAIANCTGNTIGGDVFASFLLGVPEYLQMQTENASNPFYYRWYNYGLYVQDDWRVSSNLTLNLGLRYQFQSPRWEKYNLQGQMNLARLEANPFAVSNLVGSIATPGAVAPVFEYAGVGGRSRYLIKPQRTDFEPRFGFAWTPGWAWNKDKRFVIRGGYGMAHASLLGNDRVPAPNVGSVASFRFRQYSVAAGTTDALAPINTPTCGLARCDVNIPMQFGFNNYVITPDITLFRVPSSGLIRPGDAVPGVFPNLTSQRTDVRYNNLGFVADPNFRTPTIQNYSLQLEYQFMSDTVVRLGYQGSRGTHLFSPYQNLNEINPFTGAQPLPGYNGGGNGQIVVLYRTGSASTYHAAIAEVERRFSKGVQFRFNYTYSKSLDDSSGGINFDVQNQSFNNSGSEVDVARNQDPENSRNERAVSSFDAPHVFNLVGLFELPFGKGKSLLNRGGVVDAVVGGWQLSTIGRLSSGYPVAVTLGAGNSIFTGTRGETLRPDLIPGVPLKNPEWTPENAATTPYINPRAFAWPDPGRYGTAPRNLSQLRLPWRETFDVGLQKRFRAFGENRSLEFRVEVFNVFNHRVFTGQGASLNLFGSGAQNALINQNDATRPTRTQGGATVQPGASVPGAQNAYANLGAPGVWDAILDIRLKNVPTATAIANLPGTNGVLGVCNRALEVNPTATGVNVIRTNALSPACAVDDLAPRFNAGLFRLNQNAVSSRIFQFGLKFYF